MNISADTGSLRALGEQVMELAGQYANEVKSIYTNVDELSSSWQGADNQEYVNKVNSYKATIEELGKSISNYGRFLVDTSTNIEKVQNSIMESASRL